MPGPRQPRRPRPTGRGARARRGAATLALLLVAVAPACSDGEGAAPGGEAPTTSVGPPSTTPTSVATASGCPTYDPARPLPAELARVRLSEERACPAYVTVRPGTPVTFENLGEAPQQVLVVAGPGAGGPTVLDEALAPGATTELVLDEPGVWSFTVSALEGFRGVVEVLADSA